jgi:NADH dehydrogenase
MPASAPPPPRVVILGGGYAGAYCAQALERLLPAAEAEVVLIDRNNYFVFFPLLIEAGTGSLEPRHVVVSIRAFLRRTRFIMAEVVAIDAASRRVEYRVEGEPGTRSLTADHLVIALGSITRLPPESGPGAIPGVRAHALQVKSLADAVALRDRAIYLLEQAAIQADPGTRREILHWVVVGGNFTGAEVAAEFHQFLRRAARRYPSIAPADDIRVTLVERAERILAPLGPRLSDYALANLTRRGIDVRLRDTVVAAGPTRVRLASGEDLRARTLVWCAGIEPNPLLGAPADRAPATGADGTRASGHGLPLDDRGYVLCERDLRVRGFDSVWAIGDCAVNVGPDGHPYPATAQHAIREGACCARNIGAALRRRPTTPCNLRHQGSLAALGCRTGVASVFGVRLSGFSAWFLWRTVYLLKMPGWSRRIRMAMDWTLDLFFPREDVALGIHRPRPPAGAPDGPVPAPADGAGATPPEVRPAAPGRP